MIITYQFAKSIIDLVEFKQEVGYSLLLDEKSLLDKVGSKFPSLMREYLLRQYNRWICQIINDDPRVVAKNEIWKSSTGDAKMIAHAVLSQVRGNVLNEYRKEIGYKVEFERLLGQKVFFADHEILPCDQPPMPFEVMSILSSNMTELQERGDSTENLESAMQQLGYLWDEQLSVFVLTPNLNQENQEN
jgi:hypothetical protein